MSKFKDFILDAMILGKEYDDPEDIIEEEDDEEEDERPKKKATASSKSQRSEILPDAQKPTAKVRPMRSSNKVVQMRHNTISAGSLEVCVIKPINVDEDAWEIADTLLSGRAVILNLEGINVSTSQRIIDITAGTCYAIKGNLKRISDFIFIATPEAVDISGDFQELLGSMSGNGIGDSTSVLTPDF